VSKASRCRSFNTLEVPFQIIFGQTEASPAITLTRLDDSPDDRAETLGRALPMTEVKIADPLTGETVPLGAIGELCTCGYNVMKGYFENPQATAEAIDPDGWLRTGDLGSMDERGYCRIEHELLHGSVGRTCSAEQPAGGPGRGKLALP
jgi:fatty-acyl-CoA synthase